MTRVTNSRGVMTTIGLETLPARVDTADPTAAFSDQFDAALSLDANGKLRVQTGAGVVLTTPGIQTDALAVGARVVAPAAGAAIATIAAPPAGFYEIQVTTFYDGAVVAAELNNLQLQKAAGVVAVLLAPVLANVIHPVRVFRLSLSGAQAVSVNAIAVATAGVGYNAQIVAIRLA